MSSARIDRAGCYEALLEPVRQQDGIYYAEFFEPVGSDCRDPRAVLEARRGTPEA